MEDFDSRWACNEYMLARLKSLFMRELEMKDD